MPMDITVRIRCPAGPGDGSIRMIDEA